LNESGPITLIFPRVIFLTMEIEIAIFYLNGDDLHSLFPMLIATVYFYFFKEVTVYKYRLGFLFLSRRKK